MAKPKLIHVRIDNSWYRSGFIWTSTGTDGSQNYLEHWNLFSQNKVKCETYTESIRRTSFKLEVFPLSQH